jgi:4'-phosphopantetheinyl transferase
VVGCDLALVEPRSDAFVRAWLAPAEQAAPADERSRLANPLWTAKEASAKVRREGLRLDVRQAAARTGAPGTGWRPLAVEWAGGERMTGWWPCAALQARKASSASSNAASQAW